MGGGEDLQEEIPHAGEPGSQKPDGTVAGSTKKS
jgi:hypothetical protein